MPRGAESRVQLGGAFMVGDVLVEPDFNTVVRGGEPIHLELKVMELLVFMAERGSRLITRRELVDGVWGTEFICDNTLTHAVSELRTALADDPHQPRFIATIHRRGYRLLAPVTTVEGRPLDAHPHAAPFRVIYGARSIQLKEGENLIGRSTEATVRVDSVWVSRHHARIMIHGGAAILEDLDSRNGTFVNGRRVAEPVRLDDGDALSLGRLADALYFRRAGPEVSTEPAVERTPITPHLRR